MKITENTTIADVASAIPSSVRVFQRHGIDFCCGGKTPLAVACQERGVRFGEVVSAIEASALVPNQDRDWTTEPLHLLIDHIVSTYHDPLRHELTRLEEMAAKVLRVHGSKAAHLARLDAIVAELSAELRSHMRKEEIVLFPAIRALEERQSQTGAGLRIHSPIAAMMHEHDHAGALLAELRVITDGYATPAWACATVRALYDGLSELEAAMHVHVHLENNILFPRSVALAG
jgi:regulator of cell morphogenesis and NO signaling